MSDERTSTGGVCHFFFQAEDGIRDYKVTGVQTCALPISIITRVENEIRADGKLVDGAASPSRGEASTDTPASAPEINIRAQFDGKGSYELVQRSEERRVGKERRCRGARDE